MTTTHKESPRVLDGKTFAAAIRADIAAEVAELVAGGARQPKLVAVLAGDDPASKAYVKAKAKACIAAGVAGEALLLPPDISRETMLARLDELNADDTVDGILVQLPLPDHLEEREIVSRVDAAKDVDGFLVENVGRLWLGENALTPATPTGVIEMLHRAEITLKGMNAVVVGRSNIVGKPMAALLIKEHCTVTVCHSRTKDLPGVCRGADLLVAAIGRPAMITEDFVQEGAVVVDVGINRITDAAEVERLFPGDEKRRARFEKRGSVLVGDVDYTRVAPKCSAITPVPGGVGPLTIAMVLGNTVKASKLRQGIA